MIPHTLDASALLLETSYEELQEVESKLRHQNLLTGVRDTDTWKAVLALDLDRFSVTVLASRSGHRLSSAESHVMDDFLYA
jgi:hypothetical protein